MEQTKKFDLFIRVTNKASPDGGAVMLFIDGPYKGVEFSINLVKLSEEGVLDFDYEIMSDHEHLVKNKDFEKELGDFVVYLLMNPDIKIGKNVPSTPNSNSPESNS